MNKRKQAYLVIAHKMDKTLCNLLQAIDYENNDIYLHMDKKQKSFSEEMVQSQIKKSKLYIVPRKSVMWGGYSQIAVELLLLEEAVKNGPYSYYHLLSGEDLPVKSPDTVYEYFEGQTKEFIMLDINQNCFEHRVHYYYLFQEWIGKNRDSVLGKFQNWLVNMQKKLKIRRNRGIRFVKGSNWFSITDSLARLLASKKSWILFHFWGTYCADEVFLPTIVYNFGLMANVTKEMPAHKRLIDWKRGNPYVYRMDDYQLLMDTSCMFARKFDWEVDSQIIEVISKKIKGNG